MDRLETHKVTGLTVRNSRNMIEDQKTDLVEGKSLLLVDDDRPFLQRLGRAMEGRGFDVETAESVSEGLSKAKANPPAFAVVDMRLNDGNGLDVIEAIRDIKPDCRAIVLTGYGNIATAVSAVKMGAVDYLAKPADADDAFLHTPNIFLRGLTDLHITFDVRNEDHYTPNASAY